MSKDAIYRQEAIESICKISCGRGYCEMPCDDVKAIEQLSSAEPEKVCIANITLSEEQIREAVEKVKSEIIQVLPSAQPEIIRCKDCKYCDRGIDEDGNPFLKCLGWVYGGTQEEDFCSHAERRTDEPDR